MMDGDAGSDQLHQLYSSCDTTGRGALDDAGLCQLCRLLQLGEGEEQALTSVIHDNAANPRYVTFSEFKVTFIAYLTQSSATPATESEDCGTPSTLLDNLSDIGEDNNDMVSLSTVSREEAVSPTKRQRCRSGSNRPTHLATNLFSDFTDSKANTSVDIEKHYWDIWVSLGIGQTGYLTQDELVVFCRHSWKDEACGEVDTLFSQLDCDGDGRVSFQEFIHGLCTHKYHAHSMDFKGSPPNKKLRKSLPSPSEEDVELGEEEEEDEEDEESMLRQSLFSSISHDTSGLASPDRVTSLWDELDVGNTTAVLMSELLIQQNLGFDPQSKVNLHDLSHRLDQEVTKAVADSSSVALHAAVATYQHELQHLRSLVDHLISERGKLRRDLTESTTRNNLLLHEVDEQQESIQKSAELNIKTMKEGYERRIKHLGQELESEREHLTQEILAQQHYEINPRSDGNLREKLTSSRHEVERLEVLLDQERDKTMILERTVARLDTKLKECEDARQELSIALSNSNTIAQSESDREMLKEFEARNKQLKDEIDEKSAELEEVRHELVLMMRHRETTTDRGSPLLRYLPTLHKPAHRNVTDLMKYTDETSYDFDGSFDLDPNHQSPTEDPIDYFCMYNGETLDQQLRRHDNKYEDDSDLELLPSDLLTPRDDADSPVDFELHREFQRSDEVAELKEELIHVRLVLAETQQRNVELIDELAETRATVEEMKRVEEGLVSKGKLMEDFMKDLQQQIKSGNMHVTAQKQKLCDYDIMIRGLYTDMAKLEMRLTKCDKLRSQAVMHQAKLTNQNTSLKKVIQTLRESARKNIPRKSPTSLEES